MRELHGGHRRWGRRVELRGGPGVETATFAGPPAGYAEARPEFAAVVAPGGSATLSRLPVSFGYHNAYRGVPDSAAPGSYRGIDHALISYAAMSQRMPIAPVSPQYGLRNANPAQQVLACTRSKATSCRGT